MRLIATQAAYSAMWFFLKRNWKRNPGMLVAELLSDTDRGVWADRAPADPAVVQEWRECVVESFRDEPDAERLWRAMEPASASCTDNELVLRLDNGMTVTTPLWWYPRLLNATPEQRSNVELSPYGMHWPDVDEDLSVEGILSGLKAPGAKPPAQAAE